MEKPKPKLKKKKISSERETSTCETFVSLGEFDFLEGRDEEDDKGLAEYKEL